MWTYRSGLLRGYFFQGEAAAVEVEIRSSADFPYRCAIIYRYTDTGEPEAVAEYKFRSLHGAYQWLSRKLDGKPKIFGAFNLVDLEKLRAIRGGGADEIAP